MDTTQESRASGLRVLVVDDDPTIRLLLSKFLEMQNCEAEAAASGEEALELLNAGQFDVIMADLQMPGMSGIEFAQVVRQQQPDIPIALITGVAHTLGENDLERAGITK
ncbi:MAG: response regulator, partial [Candidatus Tectomicrobia bacterium]|nr:response regulator [Candidatus Tectomicrobia bacterium]